MRSPVNLAWRQLGRERLRFTVALAGVAFAVILMLMQLGFRTALFRSSVRLHERLAGEVVLISPQSPYLVQMRSFPRRRLDQARGAPGVASTSALYVTLAFWENPETGIPRNIFLVGFDPSAPALDIASLGGQLERVKLADEVLFDRASRPEYGPVARHLDAGRTVEVEVNDRRVRVGGLFQMGTSFGVDGTVLTSDLNFLRLNPHRGPGQVEIGVVKLEPGASPEAVRDALAARLPPDVLALTRDDLIRREIRYWNVVTPIGYVFNFGVMIGFGVGAIIVSQILFADVSEHLPEYATLKAIGYANPFLYGVVLSQAVILAVLGYLPGLALTLVLYHVAEKATLLPMEMDPTIGLLVLGLTVSMCCLSGMLALRKVQTADPAEIF
ncbi:MAG TPA: ABC transporter permease DevC [Vicinamibacteria bacterium]|nr:ABC transporter permease DevC [Vicinamibacteria bacterium]